MISTEIQRLQSAKSDLATAIANKGVTVPANATLDGYAALVDSIQTGGGGSSLPYDAEVEYIESTGTQYIDTGITIVYATDIVEMSLNIAITSNTSRQLNGANGSLFFGINASKAFEFSGASAGTYNNSFKDWYLHCKTGQKVSGAIDGVTKSGSAAVGSATYEYAIYLFALGSRDNAAASFFVKQKLRNTIIKKNGMVVRYFIPVRVGQTGYLYDKVSGNLFGNAGTSSFTLGPDVS